MVSEASSDPRGESTTPNESDSDAPGQERDLGRLLKMLHSPPDVRRELVADIRTQVNEGSYLTEEKLNLAIYRLLKDILD